MMNRFTVLLLLVSNDLFAGDSRLLELVREFQIAKSEYGEFSSQSLHKQRKVQIYSQARSILSSITNECTVEIESRCNLKSERDVVSCLDSDRDYLSESCNMALSSFIGGQYFDKSFEHKGILISKGSYFFYQPRNPKMKIVAAVLTEGFNYKGVEYKSGRIDFNINGLESAYLAYDQIIDGVLYSSDLLGVFFHDNGKVKEGVLAADTKFGSYVYKASTQISLDERGNVTSGRLANDYMISGEKYAAGDLVVFEQYRF